MVDLCLLLTHGEKYLPVEWLKIRYLFFKQHQQPTWKWTLKVWISSNAIRFSKKTAGGQVGIVKICKKFLTSIVKEKAG